MICKPIEIPTAVGCEGEPFGFRNYCCQVCDKQFSSLSFHVIPFPNFLPEYSLIYEFTQQMRTEFLNMNFANIPCCKTCLFISQIKFGESVNVIEAASKLRNMADIIVKE